jgi:hypothetical protein
MEITAFWKIIDEARARATEPADGEEVAEQLAGVLATRSAAEVIEFAVVLEGLQDESYRWDLWAAAYLINGGCSDDGFDYFRGWLVAQGQAVWDAALLDPDSLASVRDDPEGADDAEAEGVLGAAMTAYGLITGDEDAYWEALPERADGGRPGSPAGESFDFDDADEMRRRLPRLSAVLVPGDSEE